MLAVLGPIFSLGILILIPTTAAAEISLTPRNFECQMHAVGPRPYQQGYRERTITVTFNSDPAQALEFGNRDAVLSFIKRAIPTVIAYCRGQPNFGGSHMPPPISPTHVVIQVGSPFYDDRFTARVALGSGTLNVTHNGIVRAHIERQQRSAEQQRRQDLLKAAAEEKEKRKQVALKDCGSSPKISGGPWFSSTYSVAANDRARTGDFLCVKMVEYVSAAPNPFGGKAARARFVGYDNYNYQPKMVIADFPY